MFSNNNSIVACSFFWFHCAQIFWRLYYRGVTGLCSCYLQPVCIKHVTRFNFERLSLTLIKIFQDCLMIICWKLKWEYWNALSQDQTVWLLPIFSMVFLLALHLCSLHLACIDVIKLDSKIEDKLLRNVVFITVHPMLLLFGRTTMFLFYRPQEFTR